MREEMMANETVLDQCDENHRNPQPSWKEYLKVALILLLLGSGVLIGAIILVAAR